LAHNFKHISHWEFLTPKEAIRYAGNELKAFIVNYFNNYHFALLDRDVDLKPDENLLFSLVEVMTVNINDLKGVGDTFIYSHLSDAEVQHVFKNYFDLLEKFKRQKGNFITEYFNWYYKEAYLLQISQDYTNRNHSPQQVYKWNTIPFPLKEQTIQNLVEEINDEKIVNYLNDYAERVVPTLRLDKCPHSFILIKPVALIDDFSSIKPIGNFFFHISLKEKLTEIQIVNFLNLFLLTWVRKYWNTIFKGSESETNKPQELLEVNLYSIDTTNLSLASNLYGGHNINEYLQYFFVEDQKVDGSFVRELHEIILPIIVQNLFLVKARKGINEAVFSSYIYSVSCQSFKSIEDSLDKTRELLITHLLIKTAVLIFELHFEQILRMYRSKTFDFTDYKETRDTATTDDLKYYLQRDRFIYLGHHNVEDIIKIRQKLIERINEFEKDVFKKCYDVIKRLLDVTDDPTEKDILIAALSNTESILKNG
jgi:hypothetical protein